MLECLERNANGLRVCCFAHGPENGRPAILLHGAGGNGRWWDLTARFLASRGYRAFAPDLRGHGDTEKPDTGYDLETTVADLLALADSFAIEKAVWFGHSWTGKALVALGARHPGRVERLVLIDPANPAGWGRHRDRMLQWGRDTWTPEVGPHPSAREAADRLRTLDAWRNWEAVLPAFEHGFRSGPDGSLVAKVTVETVLRVLGELDTNLEPLLPEVPVPALVVSSRERERSLRRMAEALPQGQFAVVEANHWVHTDNPDGFHAALHSFV